MTNTIQEISSQNYGAQLNALREEDTMDQVTMTRTELRGELYYKISNVDHMRPFFMSIVSHSNHWMFISSNGGLTAGRKNAEFALFPYYTDDKITESAEITGSKSIFRIKKNDAIHIWEPFSERHDGRYKTTRNLYKGIYGNKILFEEINHDLQIVFQYEWNSSDKYGFIRKSTLINQRETGVQIDILDGIQNVIPAGVGSDLQNSTSNLVDAYKRNELISSSGLGIYALSAFIVDKAEPSESLKANVAWSIGLENPLHTLSSLQLADFRKGNSIIEETDIKAEKGAYFVSATLSIPSNSSESWVIATDVNKDHSAIVKLSNLILDESNLYESIETDIDDGTQQLIQLNASSDGLQLTADKRRDSRHFANVLFNIMRGGIFDHNYQVEKSDFSIYLKKANEYVFKSSTDFLSQLPEYFQYDSLLALTRNQEDPDLARLVREYLPLKFSRRHGDPSRPWNKFSINTRSEHDGSKILDYEGNWRDIFQNWEALAHAYPEFIENMIHKFLNATTFDGYNPYRVTKGGFDWETIEADDPWSYIGYWGDHQIIYLLKFLELIEDHAPGKLANLFDKDIFVYANVPYKIKSYAEILSNPKDTIDFDHKLDARIRERRSAIGADGALVRDEHEQIHHVNFLEKILATLLAKISNFIPEAGIWMNTQRPEWNDANNALVGNGVSMVTLYYLRRFLSFFDKLLTTTDIEGVKISNELVDFYKRVRETLESNINLLDSSFSDAQRKLVLDQLGEAASDFRLHMYKQGLWGRKRTVSIDGLRKFTKVSLSYLEHAIEANQRTDNLYHAYNLMTVENDNEVSISRLSEMLEGQVAVLSSGYLKPIETLQVLDGLKQSALFRDDQYSYLLYPNKQLPRFMDKNIIPDAAVNDSKLLSKLVQDNHTLIIEKDFDGEYHFNGNFHNAKDLQIALSNLADSVYVEMIEAEEEAILEIFESVFNHKAFTGRSGTFYGYEGLGSIYWHMVSKLALAVQECCIAAVRDEADEVVIGKLLEHYYEINEGIGVHKSPALYGAFPTDPYSHTPAGKGAQQPGMTGQVKEDILCRFGELGVFVQEGRIHFMPTLLKREEFLDHDDLFNYIDVNGNKKCLQLKNNSLAFTFCQVPIIYQIADTDFIEINFSDQQKISSDILGMTHAHSAEIFERTGRIDHIIVHINSKTLK